MIELTGALQTVEPNQSVLFNEAAVKSGCAERWREGSGQLTLTQPGRYLVTFSGNVAVPTGGTAGEVSLGIALQGEAMYGSVMRATPGSGGRVFQRIHTALCRRAEGMLRSWGLLSDSNHQKYRRGGCERGQRKHYSGQSMRLRRGYHA